MKILQLIDTLNPGGAERMAVNYANSIVDFGYESFLTTTREEGDFTKLLKKEVKYSFLKKRKILDRKAIVYFTEYLQHHDIDVVHAHGTSWFFAVLCKLAGCNFKLIWHNHYGASREMPYGKKKLLSQFSRFFNGIISVNQELKEWADIHLKCSNSISLVNFVLINAYPKIESKTGLNVVCLANIKPVKNHRLLLDACDLLRRELKINLHLIGQSYEDDYSIKLKEEFKKRSYIKFHGQLLDPENILKNMDVGVLSSFSEGMPMALLEYGAVGIPVVSTDVGACRQILEGNANIVGSQDIYGLADAIKNYLTNAEKAEIDSRKFKEIILSKFSSNVVIPAYLEFCRKL